jgi:hypothetical protein
LLEAVVHEEPPFLDTSYLVMALPPLLEGAVHVKVTCVPLRAALKLRGAEGALAMITAALESTKPWPKKLSLPGAPRSTALEVSIFLTCAAVKLRLAALIRATVPATFGAAIDVPVL